MPCNYFFCEGPFLQDGHVILEGDEFHHLRDVMRVEEGEKITLLDGKGKKASSIIEKVEKKRAVLYVELVENIPESEKKLTLGISLLRPGHLDFVVEKATEIGVDRFLIFPSAGSERKEIPQALPRRLHAICVAAMKQSGRYVLPKIVFCSSLKEAIAVSGSPLVWAEKCPEAKTLEDSLPSVKERKAVSIFIGPEAGWSKEEKIILHQYGPPIWLHDTILRAETAGILAAYAGYTWLQ